MSANDPKRTLANCYINRSGSGASIGGATILQQRLVSLDRE
jgi:hypothetical protein